MKVLVTGAAGFIGYYTCKRLAERGDTVIGMDNINNYYDVNLKYFRLGELGIVKDGNAFIDGEKVCSPDGRFVFVKGNLADKALLDRLFDEEGFDIVVNLAAQAGVRYSITNPDAYIEANLIGFYNIL